MVLGVASLKVGPGHRRLSLPGSWGLIRLSSGTLGEESIPILHTTAGTTTGMCGLGHDRNTPAGGPEPEASPLKFCRSLEMINSSLVTVGRKIGIPSFARHFSWASSSRLSDADPFGFDRSQFNQPMKFLKPNQTLNSPDNTSQRQSTDQRPSSMMGGEIFRRMAENRQNQLLDLRRADDRMRINRDEKASLDQLWNSASQLKIQSHFGPLTPASSRVIRTVRIPPTSFLNRPVMASDVERSYKKLSSWLNSAGLRREIFLNKRYEKPFLKRRRLRSERHRRRFAIEVQRRVQIINVMRMKGM
ncbi:uncharacterized protein VP01_885g3 [Puccinia sorghi]|uniref:Ribosomal protein S21 n=1 Tax=Puccinia sorghi TaxID=27349 RepID=A0A0L6U888_9BASI|nr:uncharacterized protein VP01_885g3 [Puccinia sorghi]